jgi:hypothetical protein
LRIADDDAFCVENALAEQRVIDLELAENNTGVALNALGAKRT